MSSQSFRTNRSDCNNFPLSILQLEFTFCSPAHRHHVRLCHGTKNALFLRLCSQNVPSLSEINMKLLRCLNKLFFLLEVFKDFFIFKPIRHSSFCRPSHLELVMFQPRCESLVVVWWAGLEWWTWSVFRVLEFESSLSLSGGYMCCNASWACSVYTSSFPAHEPTSNCALRWEPRCLSREKKLNLRGEDGERERERERWRRCLEWWQQVCNYTSVCRLQQLAVLERLHSTAGHQNCITFGKLMDSFSRRLFTIMLMETSPEFPSAWRWGDGDWIFIFEWTSPLMHDTKIQRIITGFNSFFNENWSVLF